MTRAANPIQSGISSGVTQSDVLRHGIRPGGSATQAKTVAAEDKIFRFPGILEDSVYTWI